MFKNILVPLDGSAMAEGTLPHVQAAADALDARVSLVRVTEAPPNDRVNIFDWHLRKAEVEAYLREQTARLQKAGLDVDSHLLEGAVAERIVEYADQKRMDLIVLSSHGRGGMSEWNVSHIAHKVLQRSTTSILLVPAEQGHLQRNHAAHYRRILIPLDGSQRAENVLPVGSMLAAQQQATLLLVHVTSRPFIFQRLPRTSEENVVATWLVEHNRAEAANYLEAIASRLGVAVETGLPVSDNVALTLHQMVADEGIDLVLLSAHGHSAQSQWAYGNVVANFIANGSAPLLIVQDLPQPLKHQVPADNPDRQPLYSPLEESHIPAFGSRREKALSFS